MSASHVHLQVCVQDLVGGYGPFAHMHNAKVYSCLCVQGEQIKTPHSPQHTTPTPPVTTLPAQQDCVAILNETAPAGSKLSFGFGVFFLTPPTSMNTPKNECYIIWASMRTLTTACIPSATSHHVACAACLAPDPE